MTCIADYVRANLWHSEMNETFQIQYLASRLTANIIINIIHTLEFAKFKAISSGDNHLQSCFTWNFAKHIPYIENCTQTTTKFETLEIWTVTSDGCQFSVYLAHLYGNISNLDYYYILLSLRTLISYCTKRLKDQQR